MDVICERCNTEYEFDETLLSARGTSVKCTNCGHVFKVYPRGEDEGRPASSWRLKRPDGKTDAIDSLRELQRRISEGELTPEDQIARGEEGWKKLGSIPELETFFQAAGVRIPSPRMRSPIPPAPARESSTPPARRPRQPTLLGVSPVHGGGPGSEAATATGSASASGPATAAEAASGPAAASRPISAPEPDSRSEPGLESLWDSSGPDLESLRDSSAPGLESLRDSSAPELGSLRDSSAPGLESLRDSSGPDLESLRDSSAGIEDAEFEDVPRSAGARSVSPRPYFDDKDDIPELPGRGWSPLSWLLLIVLVGGLALIVTQWERVSRLVGMGGDPAVIAAGVTEGDASMALGEPSGYDQAIEAYRRAVEAGGDQDPGIVAKLSNAYALAAQARIDDGEMGSFVESLEAAALAYARDATALDPRDIDAKLAEADALRLASQDAAARVVLGEARAMSFSRTAEAFRVDARLTAAEAGGGLEHGLQSARQAVALEPSGVRFLLLLARAERAAGNDNLAKKALESILAEHPGHPVATKLLAEIEESQATKSETGPGAKAPTATESAPATESVAEPAAATESAPATESTPGPATAAEPTPAPRPAPATKSASAPAKGKAAPAPKAPAAPRRASPAKTDRKPAAPKQPQYDEYDQLSKAAQSDAFVDGRPPVRDYEWYMSRGWDELAAGSYARARAFFESALEASPGSADAMDGLGKVAMSTEDFASALRYFRVAAERGHPDGYFRLGRAYERLGRNEEAVSAYYTYIKRNPTGAHAAVARAAIKTLEPRAKLPEPEPSPDESPEPKEPTQESGPALP